MFQSRVRNLDVRNYSIIFVVKSNRNKPSGEWRAPAVSNFQRNGSRPSNRIFNEELETGRNQGQKRSKSLNPLIYPEWWGNYEGEETITDQEELEDDSVFHQVSTYNHHSKPRHNSGTRMEGGWTKRVLREEDNNSLDRRLLEAKEEAMRLERMFAENKHRADSKKRPQFVEEPGCYDREEKPIGYIKYHNRPQMAESNYYSG